MEGLKELWKRRKKESEREREKERAGRKTKGEKI